VDVYRMLKELATSQSIAVLMASHDLNLAAAYCDRLVLLHEGRLVADGGAGEVLNADLLGRVYGVDMERIERSAGGAVMMPKS
jgi:ABC-type cobalamin/Fe3+-siderophores transport system ATPase subunit